MARLAETIIREDQLPVDSFVVAASAYLHDVIDDKVVDDVAAKIKEVHVLLQSLECSKTDIEEILHTIQNMSFSKEMSQSCEPLSLAGKIVQDADRLEAIGALGILRTSYYGGGKGHPIHDESIIPKVYSQKTEYRRGSTVINHFHEKLLLLPARMHTDYARKLAFERKDFMEQFLEQFHLEWNV